MHNGTQAEGQVGSMHLINQQPEDLYYPAPVYPPLEVPMTETQWNYFHRRTCQEILPGLFLGPYASATRGSKDALLAMGLTHIVCVRSAAEAAFVRPNHMDTFKYLVIEMNDSVFEGIIPHLKKINHFLDECFREGGRALVHGNGGLCRSAALVIGYVMWRHGIDLKSAMLHVQQRRFCIAVNDAFKNQLRDFELMIKAMHMVPTPVVGQNSNKRNAEYESEDSSHEKLFISDNGMSSRGADQDEVMESDAGSHGQLQL